MMTNPRLFRPAFWLAISIVLLLALVGLACSNSQPENPRTQKVSPDQPKKAVDYPQTPLATHVVFSPLVGSGGTPVVPAASSNLEISVNPVMVKIGEKVTVTVQPSDIESPTCYLFIRDSGAADVTNAVGVSAYNEVIPGTNTSQVLEWISASGGNGQVVFILRGLGEGTTEVWVSVIPGGSSTGGVVASGVSQSIMVSVGK